MRLVVELGTCVGSGSATGVGGAARTVSVAVLVAGCEIVSTPPSVVFFAVLREIGYTPGATSDPAVTRICRLEPESSPRAQVSPAGSPLRSNVLIAPSGSEPTALSKGTTRFLDASPSAVMLHEGEPRQEVTLGHVVPRTPAREPAMLVASSTEQGS